MTADYETTVNPEFAQVWLAGLYDIYKDDFNWFRTIEDFFRAVQKLYRPCIYFHNLRFDGAFILWYLEKIICYEWVPDKPKKGQFSTVISDMRQYYKLNIVWKNGNRCEIRDSLKIIRMPLRDIPKAFGIPMEKGTLDYETYTEPPKEITQEQIDYLHNDCKIPGLAIKTLWDNGNNKLSSAANAMQSFKEHLGIKVFQGYFPKVSLEVDRFIRKAYKGGYVYVPDEYRGVWCGKGFVVDVNSLYPSRCANVENTPLPFGAPIPFTGKPDESNGLLYIVQIRCSFYLKEGYLPTIQLKNNPRFRETEYLKNSIVDGLPTIIELTLTNIDLHIMLDHYHVSNLQYIGGYYFQSRGDIWTSYVSDNMELKERATLEGNKGLRTIAKNNMNEPTGKFATRAEQLSMKPEITETGVLKHIAYDEYNPTDAKLTLEQQAEITRKKENHLIYTAEACFITAYGRDKMIRTAQRLYDEGIFRYCDTDSAHCEGKMPLWLWKQCDHTKLGFWDVEGTFVQAKFLRPKTYMELTKKRVDGEEAKKYDYKYVWNIKCAGMPHEIHEKVTKENFVEGTYFPGKLQQKSVPGGAILVDVGFTIK